MAFAATHPLSTLYSTRSSSTTKRNQKRLHNKTKRLIVCNFGDIVRKDVEFLKQGFSWANESIHHPKVSKSIEQGFNWASKSLHLPKVSKTIEQGFNRASESLHLPKVSRTLEDLLWLRNLEKPNNSPEPPRSLPQPSYPGLTGVDLIMADLKALEAYVSYLQYLSKMWSRPLPEFYDPQAIEDYFNCRPHVVTLRFIEVFISFTFAAIKMRTSGILKFNGLGVDKNGNSPEYHFGNMLKETMLSLGPTFIKVGQSLSTRPDIIGSEISKALSELHDQIPPFPRTTAMQIIEEELRTPIKSVFSYVSEEPVAAASFGQVYQGRTLDGNSVAIKVQRPNLLHVVVRDIYILRLGLGLVQKIARRKSDLRVYADELGKGLLGELDYTLEAANALEFREAHARFPFIFVPRVYRHLSKKRVLTMEWVVGENPNDLLSLSTRSLVDQGTMHSERQQVEAKKRLLDMVSKGVESSLVQLLDTGLLHADPHPGNLRYTASGQIGFLDFGLICRMEKKHQFAMLSSIINIVNGDWAGLVHDLSEMDIARPGTNIRRVTMDLEDALGNVEYIDGIPDVKFSKVLGQIWSVALKYHFRMPPYYTLVLRSLASLEGLAVGADQDFKTFDAAFPYVVRKLLTDNTAASQRILHSVVLNKRKEFQWQKLALILRVGVNRRGSQRFMASNSGMFPENAVTGRCDSFEVANLVFKLLPSKDGAVLRRLLMTADGVSLVQAMVSNEAYTIRKQVCIALADVLFQWMSKALGHSNAISHSRPHIKMVHGLPHKGPSSGISASVSLSDYDSFIRDRRLKVIFFKVLESVRRRPLLMLRFCLVSLVMFVSAFALSCHRILVTWSEKYIASLSFSPRMIAFSS